MPNPWPPATIDRLLEIAIYTPGVALTVYKLISLWIKDRGAQKIKVVITENRVEIDIEGGMSATAIERVCTQARKLLKEAGSDDLQIIIPPNIDRSVSIEMARDVHKKESSKK
jgi:hypothetical protein